eukprot:COSAG01_NODE_9113_length_2549_cov_4.311020_3_plen_67_part_00
MREIVCPSLVTIEEAIGPGQATRIAAMEMREVEANKRGRKHFDGLDEEDEEGGMANSRRRGKGRRH